MSGGMAEADGFDALVNEIAERVQRQLNASKVAVSDPCSAKGPGLPAGSCSPNCQACPRKDACGTFKMVQLGAQRVTPEAIRTSTDIAPIIDHTLLKADATHACARLVPADRFLVETDCPFLAPVPRRGKRNEPAYVAAVAERVADLRQQSLTEVARQSTANACALFGPALHSV